MGKTTTWSNSGSNYGTDPSIDFTDVAKGSSGGGTYSWEISLALLFWDEMRRYQNAANPPTFDGGIVTEVPGKGKCKIKLQGVGSVVVVEMGYTNTNVKKGMYALVLCKTATALGITSTTYQLISAKNIKMGDSDLVSEYEV